MSEEHAKIENDNGMPVVQAEDQGFRVSITSRMIALDESMGLTIRSTSETYPSPLPRSRSESLSHPSAARCTFTHWVSYGELEHLD